MNAGLEQKSVWNWKLGDHIGAGSRVAKIVKITKNTFRAERLDRPGNFVTLTQHGKEYGALVYWSHVPDLEVYQQQIADKRAEKQAQQDANQRRWEDRIAAVRAANQSITVEPVHPGLPLMKAVMINQEGKTMLVMFDQQEVDDFDWGTRTDNGYQAVKKVKLDNVVAYRPDDWYENGYKMSSTSTRPEKTVDDALINLVAGHWWD